MRYLLFMLLAIAGLFACKPEEKESATKPAVALKDPDQIVAIGKVEPGANVLDLAAPLGGIVRTVLKQNGDTVEKNEVILALDDDLEQRTITEILTRMETQRTRIQLERKSLAENALMLENKKALLEKTKRLAEKGAETRQVYDDLLTEVKVLEAKLEIGQTSIRLAEDQLSELAGELKTAEIERDKKKFRAPLRGVLLEHKRHMGEAINQFAAYASFAPAGHLIVRAEVDELFANDLKIGQTADITAVGSDKRITKGKIISISPFLKKKSIFSEKTDDQEDRRVREISIDIDQVEALIINAKVECKINTKG